MSKILISLSETIPEPQEYGGTDDNLETLRSTVPNDNDQFQYYAGNPINHSPNMRRLNDQLNPPAKPKKTHVKTADGQVKKIRRHHADTKVFGTPVADPIKHQLPSGENMYYGLIPIEHNPVFHLSETANPSLSATKIKIKLN